MCEVHVTRPSGLLAPFDPPELTIAGAIDRGWEMRADGRLMEPKPEEFLYTSTVWRPLEWRP